MTDVKSNPPLRRQPIGARAIFRIGYTVTARGSPRSATSRFYSLPRSKRDRRRKLRQAVFVGIADFLGYPADETLARVTDFVGDYVIYRYSFLAPGYILQGSLSIAPDPIRKALRTTELYRIQSEMMTRIKGQPEKSKVAEERSKVQDLNFPRTGYFFPRSPISFVMISKKTKKRENEPVEIQSIYFDNIYESTREPELMVGVMSDWHGDTYYTTRVVAQKLGEPLGDDYIKTLDPADVNDIVNAYLMAKSEGNGFLVAYP